MQESLSQDKIINQVKKRKCTEKKLKEFLEIIERTAEKTRHNVSSPSAIKPNCDKSPSPRVNLYNPFVEAGKELGNGKRKVEDTEKIRKRVKKCAFVEFFDPVNGNVDRFACYPDKDLVIKEEFREKLSVNENDDDCATTKQIMELSREYCITQLIRELTAVECKRNTM